MKRCLAALLISLPTVAISQETPAQCTNDASAFNFAASFRDEGLSPQQTLDRMRTRQFGHGLPDGALKILINEVYSDPDLSRWTPSQIYSVVVRQCMFPAKTYAPLQ